MEKAIEVLSILVMKREKNAARINEVLTKNGHLVLGRMGIPLQKRCVEDCSAVITVVLEATKEECMKLKEEIDIIEGTNVKASFLHPED